MANQMKIALFVDADNASPKDMPAIMAELTGKYGEVIYRRAYRHSWNDAGDRWHEMIVRYSMQPVFQPSNAKGKNSSDIKIIIDAMDALYAGASDCFCIVSSDSDFTSLAVRLREGGMTVIGIGEHAKAKDNSALVRACSKFIFVENLRDDGTFPLEAGGQASAGLSKGSADDLKDIEQVITDILMSRTDGDEGMFLSKLKPAITNRRPDFDERSFGFSSFSKFVASLPDMEVYPPEEPLRVRATGGAVRFGQVCDLISDFVRKAKKQGRTVHEINKAMQHAFPGITLRALGYTRMVKMLDDVPGITLITRKDGTVVAIASSYAK